MRVKWLQKALRNLDAEASYIAADDEAAARLVVTRVVAAVDALASQPSLGRPGRVPGTRELVVRKTRYIVPYRIRGVDFPGFSGHASVVLPTQSSPD